MCIIDYVLTVGGRLVVEAADEDGNLGQCVQCLLSCCAMSMARVTVTDGKCQGLAATAAQLCSSTNC